MAPKAAYTLGQKYGIGKETIDRWWDENKESCKKQYGYREDSPELYECAMGLLRKRLEQQKEAKFSIEQKLLGGNSRVYVEDIDYAVNGLVINDRGVTYLYILPDNIFEMFKATVYGDRLTQRQMDVLDKYAIRKIRCVRR